MHPLDAIGLTPLMDRTSGRPEIRVGLIDGPVLLDHPELASHNISDVSRGNRGSCVSAQSAACLHGTLVAGILSARRGSAAPAICPDCTLVLRPIFPEAGHANDAMPSATPEELAQAIVDCVEAGARVLNVSAELIQPSTRRGRKLGEALDHASSRGVIVVAAAGNQGTIGGSMILRHPSVIPVAGCDVWGRPLPESNLGSSIGRRGLMAPGAGITSLGTNGKPGTFGGTSAAAPFVTGAIALLWSEFPHTQASRLRYAVTRGASRRRTIAPPVLDVWAVYQAMKSTQAQEMIA
jgi:subtilisin family serine protease